MADESKTSDLGSAAEVTTAFIDASTANFEAEPKNLVARNAVAANAVKTVIRNREAVVRANHVYNTKVPVEGKATYQKSSGRCWMFAATNIMRLPTMAKFNLPNTFEFSQSYLFFFDKLEKSNYFLENILDTTSEEVGSRVVQHLLSDPICDGGQWDMIVNLVNKYGLVPKSAFPECHTSSASRVFNRFLVNQLRGFACRLRKRASDGATLEELRAEKAKMMEVVHRILLIHFGTPPKKFDWTFYDKDKKFVIHEGLTPQSFYSDLVPFDVNDYVSLINDPRNGYGKLYTVERLGNITGGLPVRYINVPSDKLRSVARSTIEAGKPVWFGCDVGKHLERTIGLMDLDIFDYDLTYGAAPFMTKAERLLHHESLMTHAMVFTGVDTRGDKVLKWRVENSWGSDKADSGYYIMTDAWFDEFMYQIVVEKSSLDAETVAVLEQDPVALPPWDPMGSLAKTQCDEPDCGCGASKL